MKAFVKGLIIGLFVLGCKETKIHQMADSSLRVVDLNKTLQNSDDETVIIRHINSVDIIKLETTDKSVVSQIYNIVVSDEFIYVHDSYQSGGLAIFRKDGSFVKRLKRGNGPGELNLIEYIFFDKKRNQLIVKQNYAFSRFAANGDFIESVKVKYPATSVIEFNDGYLCVEVINDECYVFETDSMFNQAVGKKVLRLMGKRPQPFFFKMISLNTDDSYSITRPYDNMIYEYKNNLLEQRELLEYNDVELDIHTAFTVVEIEKQSFKNKDKYIYCGKYFDTEQYELIQFWNGARGYISVYRNKKNGEAYTASFISNQSILFHSELIGTYNNQFVSYYDYEITQFETEKDKNEFYDNDKILSIEQKNILKQLKDDDNPIIFIYSLK